MPEQLNNKTTNLLQPLTDAEIRRSTAIAILLTVLLPPALGSLLAALMGFYPFPEIYLIFKSYTGLYVAIVTALALASTPRAVRFVTALPTRELQIARADAKRVFSHLPLKLFACTALYTVGGALSADYSLEAMGIRQYTPLEHLFNQLCVLPVALIVSFPIFFYYIDRLGRYLGPRDIHIMAAPLRTRLVMLGIVTPLLIDTVLINYYLNQTGYFEWQTLALWTSLLLLAAGGTWLAWQSLRQGIAPLATFVDTKEGSNPERVSSSLHPFSLDELGVLTARYADLLESRQRAENLANIVIDQAGALVVLLDHECRIVRFNRAAEQLCGYSFAEVAGKYTWDTLLPPEDAETTRKNTFEALARHPQSLAGQHTAIWVSCNGQRYFTEWTNTLVLDAQGQMQYMISIGTDITARHDHDRSMDMLLNASRLLEHTLSYAEVASVLRDTIRDLIGYQNSWLFLTSEDGRFVHLIGAKGETVEGIDADSPLAVMETRHDPFLRRLVDADCPDVIEDMRTETNVDRERAAILDNRTTINVPLRLGDRRLGFFGTGTFGDEGVRVPTEPQVQFLQSLSSHVSAAVDRIRSTRTVQENEERVRLALAGANQGLYDLDLKTGEALVSPEYATMLGYDPTEFHETNELWRQRLHPEDQAQVYQVYTDYISGRRPDYRVEFRQRTRNGDWKWILSLGKIVTRDAMGQPLRMLGTHTDITERKHIENELLRHREQLEDAVKKRTRELQEAQRIAHVGNWYWNIATQAVTWSDETCRIFGYEPDSVAPNYALYESHIHPDDRAMMQQFTQDILAGRRTEGIDYRLLLDDGSLRWVHGEAAVTRDPEGKPAAMTGTLHDITARKQAEQELIRAKDIAERANRAKSEFLSRMSHELRTPMNAILGFAQVLEMGKLTPDQAEFVKEIRHAGDHLLELINELLDLSRIEAGKLTTVLQPVAVKTAVADACQIIQELVTKQHITLVNHCDDRAAVLADPTRLKQILVNLLSNAAKYNRVGGRILLACQPVGDDRLRIAITDTGPGIAPENIARLFIPFERLGAEYSPIDGTGIGLAFSHQLAELMGGRLGLDSTPGEGSTFWIDLPAAAINTATRKAAAKPDEPAADTHRLNVLYLEDNNANLRVVEAMFRHQPNLKLLTAINGEHGLELAREYQPDMILLDIHLPGMDGYEVFEALKADPRIRDIPVVALSADAMPIDIEKGLKAGFVRYLTKPVKAEELLGVMKIFTENKINKQMSR